MSEKKRTALLLGFVFLSLAVIWAIMLPKGLSNRKAEAFAQPFFSHAAPQGAEVLQQTATRQKEDGAYVTDGHADFRSSLRHHSRPSWRSATAM